ncbi:MAG: glycosyltransferase [Bdellovibrionia bacterium]
MHTPKHSIVIPVYNELGCLPTLAERLEKLAQNLLPDSVEVLFVNDGARTVRTKLWTNSLRRT